MDKLIRAYKYFLLGFISVSATLLLYLTLITYNFHKYYPNIIKFTESIAWTTGFLLKNPIPWTVLFSISLVKLIFELMPTVSKVFESNKYNEEVDRNELHEKFGKFISENSVELTSLSIGLLLSTQIILNDSKITVSLAMMIIVTYIYIKMANFITRKVKLISHSIKSESDDQKGFIDGIIKVLLRNIENYSTIYSLEGGWGTGKTVTQKKLAKRKTLIDGYYIVDLNSEIYLSSDQRVSALIAKILEVISNENLPFTLNKLSSITSNLIERPSLFQTFLKFLTTPNTTEIKELKSSIEKLSKGILVIVDDIDRLPTRQETIELISIIRSFEECKRIHFLLLYDRNNLISKLKENSDYLDKYIDIPIQLPKPNFNDQITELIKVCKKAKFSDEEVSNIDFLVKRLNQSSYYFRNYREFNKIMKLIEFEATNKVRRINIIDFIILKILSINEPEIYTEIQNNPVLRPLSTYDANDGRLKYIQNSSDINKKIFVEVDNKEIVSKLLITILPSNENLFNTLLNIDLLKTSIFTSSFPNNNSKRLHFNAYFDSYFYWSVPKHLKKLRDDISKLAKANKKDLEFKRILNSNNYSEYKNDYWDSFYELGDNTKKFIFDYYSSNYSINDTKPTLRRLLESMNDSSIKRELAVRLINKFENIGEVFDYLLDKQYKFSGNDYIKILNRLNELLSRTNTIEYRQDIDIQLFSYLISNLFTLGQGNPNGTDISRVVVKEIFNKYNSLNSYKSDLIEFVRKSEEFKSNYLVSFLREL